ncbi:uncharacterized protein DNG_05005 [Cephalotrichum gorgonifer]|uniref:Sm domain-containing protein n=1 Tax=Cephalotrichum gorgonifer TaxID=2041049 RepID=A0AAE8MXJ5_9PEZI|nr:uncharacterized protein DNG_05005 [Cephalotrichum gorgonifer]
MEQPVCKDEEKEQEARDYLSSLLNKSLRITSTDGRVFWGQFKCIDPDRNIVLAQTYEYRHPSPQKRLEAAQKAGAGADKVSMGMTSRFLGLVVVPGEHIVKIEVEEFASQMRKAPAAPGGSGVSAPTHG